MKTALFRSNGYGVILGRLNAPNELCYSDYDKTGNTLLKSMHLTGNVVDTEYNDVFVIGKRISEFEIEVSMMESLYANGEIQQYDGIGEANFRILVVPTLLVQEIKDRINVKNYAYKEVKITGGDHITIFLNVYGDVKTPAEGNPYVFLINGSFEETSQRYGNQYSKPWITKRARLVQQMET